MSFTIIKDYYKDQGNKIVKKKSKEKVSMFYYYYYINLYDV